MTLDFDAIEAEIMKIEIDEEDREDMGDQVLQELHDYRAKTAKYFNYDIHALCDYTRAYSKYIQAEWEAKKARGELDYSEYNAFMESLDVYDTDDGKQREEEKCHKNATLPDLHNYNDNNVGQFNYEVPAAIEH
jgi:hypothetical protein